MYRRFSCFFLLFLVVAVSLVMVSCSEDDDPSENDSNQAQLSDQVIIVDNTDLELEEITDNQIVYSNAAESDIEVGSIVVGGSDDTGYLRRVTNMNLEGEVLTIATTQATLPEAIIDGEMHQTVSVNLGERDGKIEYMKEGVTFRDDLINLDNTVIFEGTAGNSEVSLVLNEGSIGFEPDFDIDFDIENNELQEISFIATGQLDLDIYATLTSTASFQYQNEVEIYSQSFSQVQFISGFPIYEVITVSFSAGFMANSDIVGTFEAGCHGDYDLEFGFMYQNGEGWSLVQEETTSFTAYPITGGFTSNSETIVYIKPSVDIALYGLVGPYISVYPNTQLTADVHTRDIYWSYDFGVGMWANIGLNSDIFDIEDFYQTIYEFYYTLLSDSGIYSGPGIEINTDPEGASVYLDGMLQDETTPLILTGVMEGTHAIRLYKPGYNEHIINLDYDGEEYLTYNITLQEPQPPLPVFVINTPYDGQGFTDNVIYVEGSVHLEDNNGNQYDFTGDHAILTLNGVDQEIIVNYGYFSETISISAGQNTIQLRANSTNGDTGLSDLLTVYGNFTQPDLAAILTWSTPTADMDLHVWNPNGEHCYYINMTISDGSLDIDDTEGYGPETFEAPTAMDGEYVIMINSYSLDMDAYTDCSVQILRAGQNTLFYGPHRFTTYDYNGSDPASWWEVATIQMRGGRIVATGLEVSAEMREKIENDIRNMPKK